MADTQALSQALYQQHCAECHGKEQQALWAQRLQNLSRLKQSLRSM